MIRQYYSQRCRGGNNPLRVGVIPAGAIFYLQDDSWWRDRHRGSPVCRTPWIVEGLLNGTLCAARRNRDTGHWEDAYRAGRSDTAIIRSLRDGRRRPIAVRLLILHEDEGLRRDPATYPDLPQICSTKSLHGRVTSSIQQASSSLTRPPSLPGPAFMPAAPAPLAAKRRRSNFPHRSLDTRSPQSVLPAPQYPPSRRLQPRWPASC